jgi:hypothetical protein
LQKFLGCVVVWLAGHNAIEAYCISTKITFDDITSSTRRITHQKDDIRSWQAVLSCIQLVKYVRLGGACLLKRSGGRVISGFCHGINKIVALLGCYAAYIGSYRSFGTKDQSNFQGPILEGGTHILSLIVGN